MFRQGTRVVVVDEVDARRWLWFAYARKGQKGTIGEPRGNSDAINIHMDEDRTPLSWVVPASSVRRIHRRSVKEVM